MPSHTRIKRKHVGSKKKNKLEEEIKVEHPEDQEIPTIKISTPFTNLKELQVVLNSTNVDIIYQGLSRFKDHLEGVSDLADRVLRTDKLLAEYIKSSPECAEIFRIWEMQVNNSLVTIEHLSPILLSLIITLTGDSTSYHTIGYSIIRQILRSHMKIIYRNLNSGRVPVCQATLRLLCSMVSFSSSSAREVFEVFNFQFKGFGKLLTMRHKHHDSSDPSIVKYAKADVRTLALKFVLSFLINGDSRTKKELLELKDFASQIFRGLWMDPYPVLDEIFTVMHEHLITDNNIGRPAKVAFFNNWVLEQLLKLYSRTDPISATQPFKIPADLAHHFLTSLCSTPGQGVCFDDAGWYPPSTMKQDDLTVEKKGPKVYNKILSKFVGQLQPTEDLRQAELCVKILHVCPELTQSYWQTISLSLEPRLSSKWLANAAILHKIISLPPPSLQHPQTKAYPIDPPPFHIIMENIMPTFISRGIFSKGLQHMSSLVRYTTAVVLIASFQKFGLVAEGMEKAAAELEDSITPVYIIHDGNSVPSENWRRTIRLMREEFRRRIPDIQSVIGLLQQSTITTSSEIIDEDELYAQQQILRGIALHLLNLYQKYLPDVTLEARFDPSRFIPADLNTTAIETLIHMLELIERMPDFRWASKSSDGHTSNLNSLLSLYLTTPYHYIRTRTSHILRKLLGASILFNHDPIELDLWLRALPINIFSKQAISEDQRVVLSFVDESIARCLKTPYKYVDELVAAMEEPSPNYLYPISPLLITLLEQYAYLPESSLLSIAQFLRRLVFMLLGKQVNAKYLVILVEKIGRTRANTRGESFLRQVKAWDEACVWTNALVTLKGMCGGVYFMNNAKTEVTKEESSVVTKALLKCLNDSQPSDLPAARRDFLNMLLKVPANLMNLYLAKIVRHCNDILGWTSLEPVIEYIETRHPGAGSIFEYNDIEVEDLSKCDRMILKLLNLLPFTTLLANITPKHLSLSAIRQILESSIGKLPSSELFFSINLILLYIANILSNSSLSSKPLEVCFVLIKRSLECAKEDEEIFAHLKNGLFTHPVLIETFLEEFSERDQHKNMVSTQSLEAFNNGTSDLVISFLNSEKESDGILSHPYKKKVLDIILKRLNRIAAEDFSFSLIDNKIIDLFLSFRPFLDEDDLQTILVELLALNFDNLFNSSKKEHTILLNSLLSHAFTGLSKVSPTSKLLNESFATLSRLWQDYPSHELDNLLYQILDRSIPVPTQLLMKNERFISPSAILAAELRMNGNIPLATNPSIARFIMDNINEQRAEILGRLVSSNEVARMEFVSWILTKKPRAHELNLLLSPVVALLVAVSRISFAGEVLWTKQVSEREKAAVLFLSSNFGPTLFSDIIQSHQPPNVNTQSRKSIALCYLISLLGDDKLLMFIETEFRDKQAEFFTMDFLCVFERFLNCKVGSEKNDLKIYFLEQIIRQMTILIDRKTFVLADAQLALYLDKLSSNCLESTADLQKLDKDVVRALLYAILLDRYDNVALINFATSLIKRVYDKTLFDEPIATYLRMTIEHAEFGSLTTPPALSGKSVDYSPEGILRFAIISLVHTLVYIRPYAMRKHPAHIDILLSSYGGTTLLADRLLLDVFVLYERTTGVSIMSKMLIWGPRSSRIRHHHASMGLLDSASMIKESLNLIDPSAMLRSYTHFPIWSPLEKPITSREEEETITYDPAFFLPLFASLMSFGNQLDCRRFIEINALGVIVASLSSIYEDVRKIGYFLMGEIYNLLTHAQFREKRQIILILDALKNALIEHPEDNSFQRVPSIITVFVAHGLTILLQPSHFMYPHVNRFLLQRPFIDLEDIPMFYSLLNSTSSDGKKERIWILRLLNAGLRCQEDYKLFKRRHAWDLTAALYNSQLADVTIRKITIEILFTSTATSAVIADMTTQSGLLSWILCLASSATTLSLLLSCSRLLLRVLISLRFQHKQVQLKNTWINHGALIATTLLQNLQNMTISQQDSLRALNSLNAVLKLFYYLGFITMETASDGHGQNLFMPYHASLVLSNLKTCETYLSFSISSPSASNITYTQLRHTDSVDALTVVLDDVSRLYGEIVRMLMELIINMNGDASTLFMEVLGRASLVGLGETFEAWVIECINCR